MTASGSAQAPAMDPKEGERIAAIVAPLLPPALVRAFDARFAALECAVRRVRVPAHASRLLRRGSAGGCRRVGQRPGRRRPGRSRSRARDRARELDAPPSRAARRSGTCEEASDGPRFRSEQAPPTLDPAPVAAQQREHDATCLPSYVLAETAARDYAVFLRGGVTGEQILFAPARLPLWVGYFSNDNASVCGQTTRSVRSPSRRGCLAERARSSSWAVVWRAGRRRLLERLSGAGRLGDLQGYRFTELVPAFLRRGQRLLQDRFRTGRA